MTRAGKDDTRRHAPSLANLTQDIAGPFPLELLRGWVETDRTPAAAERLLAPYRVRGTAVSSDCSGLTRLTHDRDAAEVMALISASKEIVHAVGVAVGGAAPGGRWIADNTQMLYPPTVPLDDIVAGCAEVHRRIPEDGVRLGFCVHASEFLCIGGGLYGAEANLVELLAEEHAGPNETLLTRATAEALGAAGTRARWRRRDDLLDAHRLEAYAVVEAPPLARAVAFTPERRRYPLPFSTELYEALQRLHDAPDHAPVLASIHERFGADRTVVIAEVGGGEPPGEPAALLDAMLRGVDAARVVAESLARAARAPHEVIENAGGSALVAFADPADALRFALAARTELASLGLRPAIGIERGAVLLVAEEGGHHRVSGYPVNVASKLAHELGAPGVVRIADHAAEHLTLPPATRFAAEVSHVQLTGWMIRD